MAITQTIKKRFIASLLLGVVIFFLLLTYANAGSVMEALPGFTWAWVPLIIVLVLGNYAIRFAKWAYYTRRLGIQLARRDSLAIFMSGLMMAVTPGKLGELVKSYFVKNVSDVPMSRTASIVLAERFTDLVGVLVLVTAESFSFTYGHPLIWVSIGIVTMVMCIVINRPVSLWLIR